MPRLNLTCFRQPGHRITEFNSRERNHRDRRAILQPGSAVNYRLLAAGMASFIVGPKEIVLAKKPSGRRLIKQESPQRERILLAAMDLFALRGYHQVTIDDLGDAVGFTGPSLYRYFASKIDILVELFVYVVDKLSASAEGIISGGGSDIDKLLQLVDLEISFALGSPGYVRVYLQEEHNLPAVEHANYRKKADKYTQIWIDQLKKVQPGLSADQAKIATVSAIGAISFVASRQWVEVHSPGALRQAAIAALLSQATGQ
jgi:AcrR family transcriptional regulator